MSSSVLASHRSPYMVIAPEYFVIGEITFTVLPIYFSSIPVFLSLPLIFISSGRIRVKDAIENTTKDINSTKDENSTKDTNTENNETQEDAEIVTKEWYLEIPRIFLEAEIAEGTNKEVMDVAIGHFEESSKTAGNVCLAAHNRGYPVNYFQNLKLLKKGDTIYYRYKEFTKEYVVTENNIIEDTDWTYLEETEENTLTLITCIENEPEYRRCVRAIEK